MALSEEMQKRCDQLFKLGLKWDGAYYKNDKVFIHHTDMLCMKEEEWDKMIEKIMPDVTPNK